MLDKIAKVKVFSLLKEKKIDKKTKKAYNNKLFL